jgi:protein TonB
MVVIGSSAGLAQTGGGSAGETRGVPEITNSAPPGSKDRPIRISSGVLDRQALYKEAPIYPDDARADHVSGAVVMTTTIDDHGKVTNLSVISGPEMLREAALTAVRQWTYKPYLLNGQPVFVSSQVVVNFSLAQ